MILFLLFLFPLSAVWLILSSKEKTLKQILIELRNYFVLGIIFFIPSNFFINIFTSFFSKTYTFSNIYLYYMFTDFLFIQIFAILSCFFRFKNLLYKNDSEKIAQYMIFFFGFFAALEFLSNISNINNTDIYTLFLKPVMLFVIACLTSLFLIFKDSEIGILKLVCAIIPFALPAAAAFVPFFFYINLPIVAFIIVGFFAALVIFLFKKNYVEL